MAVRRLAFAAWATIVWRCADRGAAAFGSPAVRRWAAVSPARTTLRRGAARVSISDAYDGGNIAHVETRELPPSGVEEDGDGGAPRVEVRLRIKPDPFTELENTAHFQYFSFRSTISGGAPSSSDSSSPLVVEYCIDNAGNASYADAWEGYTVFYSTSLSDPDAWRRNAGTVYEGGTLRWRHTHDAASGDSVYFGYFPPYSYGRHLDLIRRCHAAAPAARVASLGQSLEGRELECVTVGTGPRVAWVIHRQHPGEHMAEYYAEGLLERLLGAAHGGNSDDDDPIARAALSLYTFHIVPNMNPDGAVRGHLRTNACGANLNREWADSSEDYRAPDPRRSPEVWGVLERMKETGCDVFLDVHGDELLPFNFLAQPSVPNWGLRLESLHGAFAAAYERANSDMQRAIAYETTNAPCPPSRPLRIASSQVAARFDCLSVTLEMPFKDCWSNPDPERGWSPMRARRLGATVLEPLVYVEPYLRDEGEFWTNLPEDDAYVRPTSAYKKSLIIDKV